MRFLLREILFYGLAFFLGSVVFSLLNMTVDRLSGRISFETRRSICMSCGTTLKALDMIPVLSYLLLHGRCRYCRELIGIRALAAEIFGGVQLILCMILFDNMEVAITVFAFFCVLFVVALLDLDTMEIEDGCHVVILLISGISVFTIPQLSLMSRILGVFCVSVPLLLLTMAIPGAFGGGDIKLMAASGLFLGWKITLVSFMAAVLIAGFNCIYLLALKRLDRKTNFAFGPFLCVGMEIGILWGRKLIEWYF